MVNFITEKNERKCKICGCDISHRHGNAIYCKDCAYEKSLESSRKWKKKKQRLGNPKHSEFVLRFIKAKRKGKKVKKYTPLPDSAFTKSNEAE